MNNNFILSLLTLFLIFLLSVIDGSTATLAAGIFVIFTGCFLCLSVDKSHKNGAVKTLFLVAPVYFVVAYIFSLSFDQGSNYVVSDSMRYLQYYQNSTEYFRGIDYLIDTYLKFSDNNGLYNSFIQYWAAVGNLHFGGATVFYMTLSQSLFGIFSSIILYRIIARRYPEKAVKYAVTFSCLSLFLFYSSVIIRDITMCVFFLYALDYLTQPFRLRRFVLLIIFAFVVWGIRLYSGLFFLVFPATYIILWLTRNMGKRETIFVMVIFGLLLMPVLVTSAIGEQAQAEVENYDTFSAERNVNGLFTKMSNLPLGIKQVTLTLFSQISPFPPEGFIKSAETFSQYVMGIDIWIYELYWFFIVFTFAYLTFFKSKYKLLSKNEIILGVIALSYIVINTAHPDIRRMMPVYPIIYLFYLVYDNNIAASEIQSTRKRLFFLYVALFIFAVIYRG